MKRLDQVLANDGVSAELELVIKDIMVACKDIAYKLGQGELAGIGYFFYNGGGDSADTCLKVSQLSESMGYPIQAIHVPKTVDNDLPILSECLRAVSITPQAEALITAVTPPD